MCASVSTCDAIYTFLNLSSWNWGCISKYIARQSSKLWLTFFSISSALAVCLVMSCTQPQYLCHLSFLSTVTSSFVLIYCRSFPLTPFTFFLCFRWHVAHRQMFSLKRGRWSFNTWIELCKLWEKKSYPPPKKSAHLLFSVTVFLWSMSLIGNITPHSFKI